MERTWSDVMARRPFFRSVSSATCSILAGRIKSLTFLLHPSRHLLGRIRIHQEIPYRVTNASSRPHHDLHIRRAQRNFCIGVNRAIRRAEDPTTSVHACSYLLATSTEPSSEHFASTTSCYEDGGMEGVVRWRDSTNGKGCACVRNDDRML